MKPLILATVCVSAVLVALAPLAAADVPHQMYYQGLLSDSEGAPLDSTLSMTFTIYDDETAGQIWWTETQPEVIVSNGLFGVLLGSQNGIPDTVFRDTTRWLGVTVGSDAEIVPRTKLVSIPYALRVATVDGARGGSIFGDVAIQSDLDLEGDLRAAGRATIGIGHNNAGEHCAIPGGESGTITSNANHAMLFGKEVYVNSPYRVVLFDSLYSGRLGLNRDDRNAGGIAYPIHVGTNATNGNGAYLTGGGNWMGCSGRSKKDHFQVLDPDLLFRMISGLPVQAWQYKGSDERHIGPVADDFVGAFNVGVVREDGTRDDQYLSPGDVAGVALAGVKELIQENQELKKAVDELRQRIAELEKAKASK
jgi:hypothetical protein